MSDDPLSFGARRQILTATAFVEIVETLVGDFDVIDVLSTLSSQCVELLDAAAAGILLADSDGHLRVVGSSSEQIQLLEMFQVQNREGPCLDCVRTGQAVVHSALDIVSPWPRFSAHCIDAGYTSVCAVPLRFTTRTLGCVNLFMSEPDGLAITDMALAQALADVASIVIVQDQARRDAAIREGHLQHALTSRIPIEQAKGMIAEHNQIDPNDAFTLLRSYARNNNLRLTEVAEAVVARTTNISAIRAANPSRSSRR